MGSVLNYSYYSYYYICYSLQYFSTSATVYSEDATSHYSLQYFSTSATVYSEDATSHYSLQYFNPQLLQSTVKTLQPLQSTVLQATSHYSLQYFSTSATVYSEDATSHYSLQYFNPQLLQSTVKTLQPLQSTVLQATVATVYSEDATATTVYNTSIYICYSLQWRHYSHYKMEQAQNTIPTDLCWELHWTLFGNFLLCSYYRSSAILSSCRPVVLPTWRVALPYIHCLQVECNPVVLSSCLRDVSPYPTFTAYRSSAILSSCRPVVLPTWRVALPYIHCLQVECNPVVLYVTCRPTLHSLPTGRVQSCRPVVLPTWRVALPYIHCLQVECNPVVLSSCLRDVSPYPTFTAYRSSAILSSCRPAYVACRPTLHSLPTGRVQSCRPAYVTCRPTLHSLPTGRVQSCLPVVLSSCLRDVSPYPTFTAYRSSAILSSCRPVVLPTWRVALPYIHCLQVECNHCRPVETAYVTCRPTLHSLPTGRVQSCLPVVLPTWRVALPWHVTAYRFTHCLETSYCVPTTGRVQSCLPVVLSSCLRDVSPYPTFTAYRSSAILSSCRPAYVTCRPTLHSLPTGRVQSCLPVVLSSCLRDVSPYPTFTAYRSSAILSSCRPVVLPTWRVALPYIHCLQVECNPVVLSSCLRDVSPYPTFTAYRSSAILSSCRPAYVTCRPTLHSLPTGRVQSCLPVVLSSCLRDVSPYPTFTAYRSSTLTVWKLHGGGSRHSWTVLLQLSPSPTPPLRPPCQGLPWACHDRLRIRQVSPRWHKGRASPSHSSTSTLVPRTDCCPLPSLPNSVFCRLPFITNTC